MIRNRFTSLIFWNSNNLKNLQSPANITFDITFWPSYVRSSYRSGSGAIADDRERKNNGRRHLEHGRNSKFLPEKILGPLEGEGRRGTGGGIIPDPLSLPIHRRMCTYACTHASIAMYTYASGSRKCPIHSPPFLPCVFPYFDFPHTSLSLSFPLLPIKPQDLVLIYIGLTPGAPFA